MATDEMWESPETRIKCQLWSDIVVWQFEDFIDDIELSAQASDTKRYEYGICSGAFISNFFGH
jgi:hypothetical protein